MATILLYGNTIRSPWMRHEVPLEIVDPFLFVSRDGCALVMTSSLEAARIERVLPGAELLTAEELGFHDLVEQGMSFDEADRERTQSFRPTCRWRSPTVCEPRASPSKSTGAS